MAICPLQYRCSPVLGAQAALINLPSQLVCRELCMRPSITSRPSCDGGLHALLSCKHGWCPCYCPGSTVADRPQMNAAEHRACVGNSSASTDLTPANSHSLAGGLRSPSAVELGCVPCVYVGLAGAAWQRAVSSLTHTSQTSATGVIWIPGGWCPHINHTSSPVHACTLLANARFLYQCCHYYWFRCLCVEGQPGLP